MLTGRPARNQKSAMGRAVFCLKTSEKIGSFFLVRKQVKNKKKSLRSKLERFFRPKSSGDQNKKDLRPKLERFAVRNQVKTK